MSFKHTLTADCNMNARTQGIVARDPKPSLYFIALAAVATFTFIFVVFS